MLVRKADRSDIGLIAELLRRFRREIAKFRTSSPTNISIEDSMEEMEYYFQHEYPVYIAQEDDGRIAGYIVCRISEDIVWAEQMYVLPSLRRKGIGSDLYSRVEQLAAEVGSESPYNWIDWNNPAIIGFLKSRGYTVLNLLELRKPRPGELLGRRVVVGKEEFDSPFVTESEASA